MEPLTPPLPPNFPQSPQGKIWLKERIAIYWRNTRFRRGAYWGAFLSGVEYCHAFLDRHSAYIIYYLPFWGIIVFLLIMGALSCSRMVRQVKQKGPDPFNGPE